MTRYYPKQKMTVRDGRTYSKDSSDERKWLSGCRNKTGYKNERIAEVYARAKQAEFGRMFRSYLCPHCDQFHLATVLDEQKYRIELLEAHLGLR